MIWSVSTLDRCSATAVTECVLKASTSAPFRQVGRRGKTTDNGCCGGHEWRDEMRTAARALATLEVAVRRRRAALARRELVGIHAQAHRAAGVAPLGAGLLEDDVESFLLRLQPNAHRAGH